MNLGRAERWSNVEWISERDKDMQLSRPKAYGNVRLNMGGKEKCETGLMKCALITVYGPVKRTTKGE